TRHDGTPCFYPYAVQYYRAELLMFMGLWAGAEQAMRRNLAWSGQSGDAGQRSDSLLDLGRLAMLRDDDYRTAIGLLDEALQLAQGRDYHHNTIRALSNIAGCHWRLGEFDRALEFYQRSLDLARRTGDPHTEAVALSNIGTIHQNRGNDGDALRCYEQARALFRRLGDVYRESQVTGSMGVVHYDRGRLAEAQSCYQEKMRIARLVQDGSGLAYALGSLAMVHADLGQDEQALRCYGEAGTLARQRGDLRLQAINLGNLGGLHKQRGRLQQAIACLDGAIAIAGPLGIKFYLADFHYHRADARCRAGELAGAAADAVRALALTAALDNPDDLFKCRALRLRLRCLMAGGRRGREAALGALERMLPFAPGPALRADLLYDLRALRRLAGDGGRARGYGAQAARAYAELLRATPKQEYRDRLAELAKGPA
ncbi:MAG TPA: tetratricopeptide repeat protein, partial [Candidatus Edwardsbacteria bacterium]|nr:tetratricopeptide repeat protein [Candidatus Edwardsbacteria bacterium]